VASTTSRSALPLPCAIQVPEQARITGSTAVTRPLAGRLTMPRRPALVDVGLAVGDHDDLVAAELGAQQRAQPLGGPFGVGAQRAAVLVFQVAQPGTQVGGKGRQFGRARSRG
jgi:hypothetical protein